MNGLFRLKTIEVNNSYQKELLFTVELAQFVEQNTVCNTASEMGEMLFNAYPFDKKYNKTINIIFNPKRKDNDFSPYSLGEVNQYKEDSELHIGCYLKYK